MPDDLLGKKVRCPGCDETFTAATGEIGRTGSVTASPRSEPSEAYREGAASGPTHRDVDDKPARPSRRRWDDEDEYDDDFGRPLRRRRRFAPHRGGSVMTTGLLSIILSFAICPLFGFIGIAAWVMGRNDLREIREGRMDPSGHGQPMAGFVMGIIGTGLGTLTLVGGLIWIAVEAAR